MSSPPPTDAPPGPPKSKRKLFLLAIPAVLAIAGAGLWFTGILPHLLGMDRAESEAKEAAKPVPPSYIDLPEMIANLNSGKQKPSYIKLSARIEVPKPEDADKVKSALPRIQDVMQTYLREMRPEELRGSAGTYRLREELIVRANAAVAPAKIGDVLFTQMLVQ
jgi:flagellar FliL protein